MEKTFDLIVLGAGSGGLAAAKRASKYGAKVAIIEGDRVGGTCVIRGCVPKKLLVYGSMYRDYYENSSAFGVKIKDIEFNTSVLLKNIRKEVDRLNTLHIDLLRKGGIELFQGWGHFIDSNSVAITNIKDEQSQIILKASHILIAVGGKPVLPDIPGIELCYVSDDMFNLEYFPDEIIIVGAGFIACEFSCILNNLGVKVRQIVRGNKLLKGFDSDLSSILLKQMQNKGIEIDFNEEVNSIKSFGEKLEVKTSSRKSIYSDKVLLATGRKPFLQGLDLDLVGIKTKNGRILVDEINCTNVSNIYAVGDVTDRFNLTPVAIDEGRAFSDRIFANKIRSINYNLIPSAVFSQPEIAAIGLTESEAIKIHGQDKIKVYKVQFNPMKEALPKKQNPCLLKIIVEATGEKILGCHMAGESSAEIIQMAAIAIGMGASKSDFDNTMALHPTIAEEYVTMV